MPIFSTGYRNAAANAALGVAPSAPIMDGCVIMLYAGSRPETADEPVGAATLIATFSTGGTGDPLAWDAASGGSAYKMPGDVWSATAVASGSPTFFRYQLPDDDGTLSNTAIRIQGRVGLVSDPAADLALSSMAIVNGAPLTIDAASATVPASM
ncbi:hypothetical protein [Comamonas sp. MYb396]|uniref:hypothetical protein n=1 Tax=Comamonas sp. MYb396 TaxID=2745302 RepID=UPI0030AF0F59